MDEERIRAFRNKAVRYFERILIAEGYDSQGAGELAFYIAKVLEDTHSLLEDVETGRSNSDEVLEHIHMLYTNVEAFDQGHKLLMYKD